MDGDSLWQNSSPGFATVYMRYLIFFHYETLKSWSIWGFVFASHRNQTCLFPFSCLNVDNNEALPLCVKLSLKKPIGFPFGKKKINSDFHQCLPNLFSFLHLVEQSLFSHPLCVHSGYMDEPEMSQSPKCISECWRYVSKS